MNSTINRKNVFLIPIAVSLFALVFVFLGIYNLWFGELREGVMLFCEHARDGFIKQPSNTFSNLAFICSGIYIGWLSYKNEFSESNYMTKTVFYPTFFASIVAFIGPGSMALHATNSVWGGFMDLFSMFLLSSFIFCYAFMRWFRLSPKAFFLFFAANVAICSAIYLSPFNQTSLFFKTSEICFIFQLVGGMILEICNKYVRGTKISAVWGWLSVFTILFSFFIWTISRTQESWFCDPHSLIQGHAIWHLLDALAAYFLFVFYASETVESKYLNDV